MLTSSSSVLDRVALTERMLPCEATTLPNSPRERVGGDEGRGESGGGDIGRESVGGDEGRDREWERMIEKFQLPTCACTCRLLVW